VSEFPNRSIPLYYQLEHILRARIESGEVLPGQRLPTEQELSRDYRLSRATVRQAMAALVSEGLLYRRQGKGTFVTDQAQQVRSVKLTGFTEDLFHQGHRPEVQVLESLRAPAPDRVAHQLHLAPGAEVVRFKRLRRAAGNVLSVVINHVLPEYGEKITAQDLLRLGVIDGIISEPIGGAHRDGQEVVEAAGNRIGQALAEFDAMPPEAIRKARREKFLGIGRIG